SNEFFPTGKLPGNTEDPVGQRKFVPTGRRPHSGDESNSYQCYEPPRASHPHYNNNRPSGIYSPSLIGYGQEYSLCPASQLPLIVGQTFVQPPCPDPPLIQMKYHGKGQPNVFQYYTI